MKLFITTFWCQRARDIRESVCKVLQMTGFMTERGRMGSEVLLCEMILIVKSDLRVSYQWRNGSRGLKILMRRISQGKATKGVLLGTKHEWSKRYNIQSSTSNAHPLNHARLRRVPSIVVLIVTWREVKSMSNCSSRWCQISCFATELRSADRWFPVWTAQARSHLVCHRQQAHHHHPGWVINWRYLDCASRVLAYPGSWWQGMTGQVGGSTPCRLLIKLGLWDIAYRVHAELRWGW